MLTKDKQVQTRIPAIVGHPVAASTTIYKGALVVLDGDDNAAPATKSADLRTIGVARKGVENESGSAGDATVEVRHDEAVRVKNDATNPVTREHIGSPCYIFDDETVTSLATGSSIAGIVYDLDGTGVWITF